MIATLLVGTFVFLFFHVVNFYVSSYFIHIDIMVAILVFIASQFSDYRGYVLSVFFGIITGGFYGQITFYIFLAIFINYLLQLSKDHFLLETPVFLFVTAFIFTSLKMVAYFVYVNKISRLTSLLVSEYLFSVLLTSLFSYPAFIFAKKLNSNILKVYEKGLHYS